MIKQVCIYTALKTLGKNVQKLNGHITTSFTNVEGKMPKIATKHLTLPECAGVVRAIAYWPQAGVTVALVDCEAATSHHEAMLELGLKYEHEFKPHITLHYGEDATNEFAHLVGEEFSVIEAYVGFIVKEQTND